MSALRMIYLALAILGAVVPMYFFVSWFIANGWSLGAMMQAWNVNDAASGLVWDLTIAAVALTIWVAAESWLRRDWLGLLAIPATWGIGVSCGLPLFLFLRGRPLR
ncbi:MAG: K+-transporting ATPase, A chain [Alphaproteobacteria bacterium HGW-Alphaproteobacteria-2]|nr:MAG: K+-transporting ATPase, A chain [Alphaproteobacteria bacterium HGW-Alphaproteobacteria-2]